MFKQILLLLYHGKSLQGDGVLGRIILTPVAFLLEDSIKSNCLLQVWEYLSLSSPNNCPGLNKFSYKPDVYLEFDCCAHTFSTWN